MRSVSQTDGRNEEKPGRRRTAAEVAGRTDIAFPSASVGAAAALHKKERRSAAPSPLSLFLFLPIFQILGVGRPDVTTDTGGREGGTGMGNAVPVHVPNQSPYAYVRHGTWESFCFHVLDRRIGVVAAAGVHLAIADEDGGGVSE